MGLSAAHIWSYITIVHQEIFVRVISLKMYQSFNKLKLEASSLAHFLWHVSGRVHISTRVKHSMIILYSLVYSGYDGACNKITVI